MPLPNQHAAAIEKQSLTLGKWGNLAMAIAGIVASWLSRSDALLIDGLYSGVNFISAIVAARVGASILKPVDHRYPFGYGGYEAIYVNFRSMVLVGILAFAVFGALQKIAIYSSGGNVPELVFGPIMVYAIVMVSICTCLALWHHHNWHRSGRQSDILKTESRAAVIDGVISAGAGGGLLGASLLTGTPLGFLVPVSDSIVVLVLSACIIRQPITMFLHAVREIAGGSAGDQVVTQVRGCVEELFRERPFSILQVAVTKLGRTYFAVVYLDPENPVSAAEMDSLSEEVESACQDLLGRAFAELVVTAIVPYETPGEEKPASEEKPEEESAE